MSRKKTTFFSFDEVFLRIRKETNIKNNKQLADFIGISESAVSNNKKKNIIPLEWTYEISKKYSLDLDWLTLGEEPERITDQTKGDVEFDFLKELNEWLKEEKKKETDIEVWFRVQFKEKFPKFRIWKEKKSSGDSEDTVLQKKNVA